MSNKATRAMARVTRLRPVFKKAQLSEGAKRARAKFLHFFPSGFEDETYLDWERDYKWAAHEQFCASLRRAQLRSMIDAGDYETLARHAIALEAKTNLLFSFEKMALRDAVKSREGSRLFAQGLHDWLHGRGSDEDRFQCWIDAIAQLPRRQARVLTWPVVTIFGMIAAPEKHIFVKPMVTRTAARAYGFELRYTPRPNWQTYVSMLEFAEQVREDQGSLRPRDMIDIQSFIWVQGSDEYEE